MIEESLDDIEDELFSRHFFAQQKIDSLSSDVVVDAQIPQGHGPFFKDIGQEVKYNLTCSKEGILLGHSHPLIFRSRLESLGHSVLTYKTTFAPEKEKDIASMILKLFGEREFQYVRLFPNRWELLYTVFENIGVLNLPEQKILCLGEVPREMSSLDFFSVFDREGILKLFDNFKVTDFSCIFINLHSQKYPTEIIDNILISEAVNISQRHALPLIVAELYFWGSYPKILSLKQEFLKNVDYYLLGNNLPLNAAVSKTKNVDNYSLSISVEKLLLTEKMLRFLTEGNFYGKDGRILSIQKEIENHLSPLSPNCRGLIFTLFFLDKDVEKIHKALFDQGIICEFSNNNIHLYFPMALLSQHIREICEIIKTTSESIACLD